MGPFRVVGADGPRYTFYCSGLYFLWVRYSLLILARYHYRSVQLSLPSRPAFIAVPSSFNYRSVQCPLPSRHASVTVFLMTIHLTSGRWTRAKILNGVGMEAGRDGNVTVMVQAKIERFTVSCPLKNQRKFRPKFKLLN